MDHISWFKFVEFLLLNELMRVRLLGPVEVDDDGRALDVGPPQQRAVLAALAADVGRVVGVSTLVDRVWGETAPAGARSALHAHLTRNRQMLGERASVVRRSGGYLLDLDRDAVDVHRLARLFGQAREPERPNAERVDLLSQAVALWRGEPLPGLSTPWAERMRAGWCQLRIEVTIAWTQAKIQANDAVEVIGPLSELVAEHPLVEPLIAAYMHALHLTGRPAEALACFAATRERLANELGTEPGPQLRELYLALLRGGIEAPQPSSPPAWGECQLRAPIADFVGRAGVLDSLVIALRGNGLAAIQGMGGVGKTELAVLAANRLRDAFPDGVVVINLRGVSAAQALRELGLQGDDEETLQRRYCGQLGGRRVLIFADDASDAAQVRPLIPPQGSALLVTSRQRFTLPGMHAVHLGLFSEAESVTFLKSICRRVPDELAHSIVKACGFLPLAIRVTGSVLSNNPALAVADYAAALADERQRLTHLRDPDDTQLDVAASLGLSYSSLDDTRQSALRRLGVFAGHFATELAHEVAESSDDTLHMLLRRNLIEYHPEPARWRLHDLVRDLARHHLQAAGEWEPVMWRYAQATLRIVEAIERRHRSRAETLRAALADFDAERSHVDTARQQAADHALTEVGDRFLVAEASATFGLIGFMRYDRRHEIAPAVRRALAAARRLGDTHGEALMLNRLGQLHLDLGDHDQAIVHFGQQLDLLEESADPMGKARALNNLGNSYLAVGEPSRAVPLYQRQLGLVREMGDLRGEAMALCNLGRAHVSLGQVRPGLQDLSSALIIARKLDDQYGECAVLHNIGRAQLAIGDVEQAQAHLEQALGHAREMGDRHSESKILSDLAQAMVSLDQPTAAGAAGERALALARDLDCRDAQSQALAALSAAHAMVPRRNNPL